MDTLELEKTYCAPNYAPLPIVLTRGKGVSVHSAATLDNSRSAVDFVRLGALSVKPTASGVLHWDEFESRRITYIGP